MGNTQLQKVVITGPTGAVGVALIEEFIAHNIQVIAVCRPDSKRIGSIPSHPLVKTIECDLADYQNLPSLIEESSVDVFYHFAWDGTFGASRQNWKLQEANVSSTIDAVKVASDLGCKVFVGAGSQSEYGHVEGRLSPDMPCYPDNGYGAAKLAACHMSRAYCKSLGIRHEWCRIISLYGPGDGEYTMVSQVIGNLFVGKHVECTKGDQIWDYIYSKDAATAFRLIAERGRDGEVYNLGTGEPRLLKDYIHAICDAIDPKAQIGFGEIDYYPNQVMHLEADIDNLVRDTGFVPRYTFEQGINETIDSYKSKHIGKKGLL